MNRHESMTEKQLREAIEKGEFDDLPGKGQPIDLRENPFEDPDLRTVHRLLRNAGFAPGWIEERKSIDSELGAIQVKLHRAWQLYGGGAQSVNPEWQRNVAEFREKVEELNQRIRIYNLKAPSASLHRNIIDADKVLEDIASDKQ
jgi:DnaJ homolog subfamily C member 28